MNAEYLKIAKEREERAAREREEGKPEKKKRRARKKPIGPSSNALDAIQKVLQEKKISSKINYDILKSLTAPNPDAKIEMKTKQEEFESKPVIDESMLPRPGAPRKVHFNMSNNRRSKVPPIGFQMASHADDEAKEQATDTETEAEDAMEDAADDAAPVEEEPDRLGDILNHREEDEYSGAEEYF